MRQRLLITTVALVALAASRGSAHHPFASYDMQREVTVTGDVVRAIYAEPHSFLHVRESGTGDGKTLWVGELKGVSTLRARGLTPQTLKAGERVTLRGNPGRVAADHRLWLTSVVRARDGWTWSAP
jgi:hypothetical protein